MMNMTQCPVCTLYLREGISLKDHLDTHPKDKVIEALVSSSEKSCAVNVPTPQTTFIQQQFQIANSVPPPVQYSIIQPHSDPIQNAQSVYMPTHMLPNRRFIVAQPTNFYRLPQRQQQTKIFTALTPGFCNQIISAPSYTSSVVQVQDRVGGSENASQIISSVAPNQQVPSDILYSHGSTSMQSVQNIQPSVHSPFPHGSNVMQPSSGITVSQAEGISLSNSYSSSQFLTTEVQTSTSGQAGNSSQNSQKKSADINSSLNFNTNTHSVSTQVSDEPNICNNEFPSTGEDMYDEDSQETIENMELDEDYDYFEDQESRHNSGDVQHLGEEAELEDDIDEYPFNDIENKNETEVLKGDTEVTGLTSEEKTTHIGADHENKTELEGEVDIGQHQENESAEIINETLTDVNNFKEVIPSRVDLEDDTCSGEDGVFIESDIDVNEQHRMFSQLQKSKLNKVCNSKTERDTTHESCIISSDDKLRKVMDFNKSFESLAEYNRRFVSSLAAFNRTFETFSEASTSKVVDAGTTKDQERNESNDQSVFKYNTITNNKSGEVESNHKRKCNEDIEVILEKPAEKKMKSSSGGKNVFNLQLKLKDKKQLTITKVVVEPFKHEPEYISGYIDIDDQVPLEEHKLVDEDPVEEDTSFNVQENEHEEDIKPFISVITEEAKKIDEDELYASVHDQDDILLDLDTVVYQLKGFKGRVLFVHKLNENDISSDIKEEMPKKEENFDTSEGEEMRFECKPESLENIVETECTTAEKNTDISSEVSNKTFHTTNYKVDKRWNINNSDNEIRSKDSELVGLSNDDDDKSKIIKLNFNQKTGDNYEIMTQRSKSPYRSKPALRTVSPHCSVSIPAPVIQQYPKCEPPPYTEAKNDIINANLYSQQIYCQASSSKSNHVNTYSCEPIRNSHPSNNFTGIDLSSKCDAASTSLLDVKYSYPPNGSMPVSTSVQHSPTHHDYSEYATSPKLTNIHHDYDSVDTPHWLFRGINVLPKVIEEDRMSCASPKTLLNLDHQTSFQTFEPEDSGSTSINMQTDELMPPRGELSGQESLESSAWGYQEDNAASHFVKWEAENVDPSPSNSFQTKIVKVEQVDPITEEIIPSVTVVLKKKKHACIYCDKTFDGWKLRKYHMKAEHPQLFSEPETSKLLETAQPAASSTMSEPSSSYITCTSCPMKFENSVSYGAHFQDAHVPSVESFSKSKQRQCTTCFEVFDKLKPYQDHIRFTHPLECPVCKKTFFTKPNLTLHMRTHLKIKPYKCDVCEKSFVTSQKLSDHKNTHTGNAPFPCNLCTRSFKRYSNLAQHKKVIHLKKKKTKDYYCHCGEIFQSKGKLLWHQETHSSTPRQCTFCGEKFTHTASLTRHVRKNHDPSYLPDDRMNADENINCTICQLVVLKSTLKSHMKIHEKSKPFSCTICKKSFYTKWNLGLHQWTHVSRTNMPFKCKTCNRGFYNVNEYNAHMRSHKNIRPYTCNYCGRKFIRKFNCVRHVREHEAKKKFTCTVCGKTFHRSYYLTAHKRVHNGERPFSCHICGKTSTTKSNHNKHVKTHHARESVNTEG